MASRCRGGQNSHLENGRAIRYSDRMSTSCATAAPTRHPPREVSRCASHPPAADTANPGCRPQRLPGRRSRRRLSPSSPIEEPLSPLSPRDNTTGDISTPTRPTTSALCRPKRIRRHKASCDTICAPLHARRARLKEEPINFWTFGPRRARPEIQKSPPFSSQFHHKTSRNKGSNAPRPAGRGKTFGPLL
jgi:hypothetical protein